MQLLERSERVTSTRCSLVPLSVGLQVWKARTFLQRSDVAGQQAYVTAALLACLARMTKDTLQVRSN